MTKRANWRAGRRPARLLLVEWKPGPFGLAFGWRTSMQGRRWGYQWREPSYSALRAVAVEFAASLAKRLATHESPISLRVKNRGDGCFSEERTYPRSCDPRSTKG